ncbi:UNVERIFIED_CONTAM: Retrovirus-related Pol polyprotein from type-1 retrotransposable element R2 [Sesamum calycinum]|uniref:Retrovirus-related Pol polyprotein from type-1 retrotransposable element R2 n=1 Tax=Sesamum calycinum TaxID=2727403 RepID=A0AAW2J539_9LAMI
MTDVGYFLGKRPYFHHLNDYVRSIWLGVREVDVEYEWLPPKCNTCHSLGHATSACVSNKPTKPAVSVYVQKPRPTPITLINPDPGQAADPADTEQRSGDSNEPVISTTVKAIWNVRGLNRRDHQSNLLPRWHWFTDYNNLGNRIWLAWNGDFIDVDIVVIGVQFIHCRILFRSIGQEPWLVGGDFNAVRDLSEVCGASGDIRLATHEFNDCIMRAGLIALPMRGVLYSWHNCSTDGRSLWKRLDRLLVNDLSLERWPDSHYECLTPRTSDHSPLLLRGDMRDPHVSMFRFDNFLALSPGFIASVQNVWRHRIIGTPMYSVTRKLKALKPVFHQQRKEKGDIPLNAKLAAEFLEISQQLLMEGRHDSLLLHLETCCRMISDDDGHTYTEPKEVSDTFVAYFERLLGGERAMRNLDLRYLRPWVRHIITEEESNSLTRPITADDVKTALFDNEEDRAPGLDGFSSGFFKAAWPVVGEEITAAVKDFFTTGRLLKQVNATLLTLIPKVSAPSHVADFRLISCCNTIYKIITKILVLRIREVLDKLISSSQTAFVPGRSISDNVMLAQELFSGYNQCRLPPRCALKVDLRKAYDIVEWDFWLLRSIYLVFRLDLFGARGLRQGDPMSPYLFVLIMEVLHMILRQFIEQDGDFAYHWKCKDLGLFQLSFADDLLLLCKAEKSQLIISKAAHGIRASLLDTLDSKKDISQYGRVQLIKSVLLALGVYWAMAFLLPKGVIKVINKRLRTFLWKGNSANGYPKVAWDVVCLSSEEGGQGIRDVLALNRALMSRHLWVGSGDSISLWHDPWHRLGPLILAFPRGLQLTQTAPRDLLNVVIENGSWRWPFITDIACLEITWLLPPIHHGNDSITWNSHVGPLILRRLGIRRHTILSLHVLMLDIALPPSEFTSDFLGLTWSGSEELRGQRHVGEERNRRRFQAINRPPSTVASIVIEEVKQRILSTSLRFSISTQGIYRLWHIPWPVDGHDD